MAGFTCFFTFLFLLALVVPLFLRLHLNLGCYVPYVIERSFILVVTFLFVGFAITLRCNTTFCNIGTEGGAFDTRLGQTFWLYQAIQY